MKKVFITGIGSGIGLAFAKFYLNKNYKVYAISRKLDKSLKNHKNLYFKKCDIKNFEKLELSLNTLLKDTNLDIAILNAGVIGKLKSISKTSIKDINNVLNINSWANKIILDYFIKNIKVKQIIGLSSGASVNANVGWGSYTLSKSILNTLFKIYAKEMPYSCLTALAPGLVKTPMLENIMQNGDEKKFKSVKIIKESPKKTPKEIAKYIDKLLEKLKSFKSGSFIDIRKLK